MRDTSCAAIPSLIHRIALASIVAAGIFSCAQIKPLTGGEKDVVPPTWLGSVPPQFTTEFDQRRVVFLFDELVQLNNIAQELVISPPLTQFPELRTSGNTITMDLNEDLLANTTYIFQFGDGVADVHEGNKASNFYYVVSTGTQIDSLQVCGRVFDTWTGKPADGIKVMIYGDTALANPTKNKPSYFTRSLDDGSFCIPFLPSGQFHLVALDDLNSNYHLDPAERFAFADKNVEPAIFPDTLVLHLSEMPPPAPVIVGYEVDSAGTIHFPWMANVFDPALFGVHGLWSDAPEPLFTQSIALDTLTAHFPGRAPDREVKVECSYDGKILDTLTVPFFEEAIRGPVSLKLSNAAKLLPGETLSVATTIPTELNDATKIIWSKPDTGIPIEERADQGQGPRTTYDLIQGKSDSDLLLLILPGAFTNAYGDTNDTLRAEIHRYTAKELGEVSIQMSGWENNSLIAMIEDAHGRPIATYFPGADQLMHIENLLPGEYTVRLFMDKNGNGHWDPGNYTLGIQPEKLWVLGQKVEVRPNWAIHIDWRFSE